MLNFNVTNFSNVGREVYIWHRMGKTLSVFKDKTLFPYFYQIHPNGIYRTIDGRKVNKVICSRPSDVKNRRNENSYEADVLFTKRYIIDKITSFGKVELKYSFVDIEVLTKDLPNWQNPIQPISCISCSNNYTEDVKTFYLKDFMLPETCDEKLDYEEAEKALLDVFVNWLKKEQFDLILGWHFIDFDWRYLQARYKFLFGCELAEMLSPIAQAKYLGSSKEELTPNLIPAGLSVMDYLEMFKKIYRTESSYALDAVAQKYLNESSFKKVDFNKLSEEIKEKNINDVRRMIDLDKKLKIIEYYDELRRMSMCDWQDTLWNSKMIDLILLREAKQKGIVLPSKNYGQDQIEIEETFEGAYRDCQTGVYKNLWKLDLGSAYPMAIINFCLDVENIKPDSGIEINGIKFYQNSGALLPTIARKLINKKDTLKQQLKVTNPETQEYKDLQIKYDAIKAVVNSLFGVCGLKIFRLFDYRVASAITYLIRDLLHYTEDKLKKQGIKVIYLDTDSCFVEAKENPKDLMNNLIKQWAKEKYNKDNVGIEFDLEGVFERIFIVALCVHPFTKILTNVGWKTIAWIYNNSKSVKIASINLKNKSIEFVNSLGIKQLLQNRKLYRISLKYGMQKNCRGIFTEDHPVLTNTGYKKINKLLKTDKIHTGEFCFIGDIEEALYGTILGDSYISQGILNITHCDKQKKYAHHKAKLFIRHKYKANYYINKTYNNKMWKIFSRSSLYFKYLEDIFYQKGTIRKRKIVTDKIISKFSIISLAYLFMDDGYMNINQCQSEIATCGFTLNENLKISNKIKSLGIDNKVMRRGKYYRICFGAEETRILSKKIAPYVIKSMNYKLRPEHRNIKKIELKYNQEHFYSQYKIKEFKNYKRKEVYDLVLDKNHNFITLGGVVHNCHYKGYLRTKSGLKEETKGIEVKRKDSSNFIKEFQNNLIEKIMNEEPKEKIIDWINSEKNRFRTLPIIDIAFPCRMQKGREEYKSIPIHYRALEYTQELIPFEKRLGDSFYYLYVEPFGTTLRKSSRQMKNKETGEKELRTSEKEIKKNVLAIDEDNFNHVKEVDWKQMEERSIYSKCEHVFSALNWSLELIKPAKLKKSQKKHE